MLEARHCPTTSKPALACFSCSYVLRGSPIRAGPPSGRRLQKPGLSRSEKISPICLVAAGQDTVQYPAAEMDLSTEAARVAVFSTVGCRFCKQAKELLRTEKIVYVDVDLSRDQHLRSKVTAVSGSQTVPQVFLDGKCLGGATDLKTLRDNGTLVKLLSHAAASPLPPDLQTAVNDAQAQRQASNDKAHAPPALSGLVNQLYDELDPQANEQSTAELLTFLKSLAGRMHDSQHGVHRMCHTIGFVHTAVKTFTFQEALNWLAHQDIKQPLQQPQEQLQALQLMQLVTVIQPAGASIQQIQSKHGRQGLLRLSADVPWACPGQPLNGHFSWHGKARAAAEVAGTLRVAILDLHERHLAIDGSAVDYPGIKKDPAFAEYVNASTELQHVSLASMSEAELKAFWINLYNMMVVHALATWGGPRNFLQRLKWFAQIKYINGGDEYSTNDIEHGMLRANAPSPSSIAVLLGRPGWAPGSLKSDDLRLAYAGAGNTFSFELPLILHKQEHEAEGSQDTFCAELWGKVMPSHQGSGSLNAYLRYMAAAYKGASVQPCASRVRSILTLVFQFLAIKRNLFYETDNRALDGEIPSIQVYTADNLDEGLDAAACAFCSGNVEVDTSSKEISLSKLFKWYSMDFGAQAHFISWLHQYLPQSKQVALERLQQCPSDIHIVYRPYDWGTNSL